MPNVFFMPRTRSNRVLWLLEEIGEPYDATRVLREDRRSPEHLARQPLGRVPAVELDDGTVMFESAAICLQLADLNPEANLIGPVGSGVRARVYQWVLFAMTELEAPLYRALRLQREGGDDASERERFTQAAGVLAQALGDHEWLVDDHFTVADVISIGVLGSAHARGQLEPWPQLQAYVERGEDRPAHRAAIAAAAPAA